MGYNDSFSIAGLVLVFIILWVSWRGFRNQSFKDLYCFDIDSILIHKEYYRLITSGFLHSNWLHLILNIGALCSFSVALEHALSIWAMVFIYFISLVGGNLFALYIHRNHGDYRALGASGAISGLIFACVALDPHMGIGFFGIGFSIPGWIFAIAFVLISIYGIRTKYDNIGHEAHLAGGITGMLVAILIEPLAIKLHYVTITLILTPAAIFIYLIFTRATFLLIDHNFTQQGARTIEDRYNSRKRQEEKEIDAILDKISQRGINSLTRKEKERLEEHARK